MSEQVRLLVVDDDPMMAKTLVDILRIKGYQAEAAHSAQEALVKVSESDLDCVLTDIKMPGMSGVDLCKAIGQTHPELPVVLMTAYASDSLVQEALDEGAIAALSKPLDIGLVLSLFSFLRRERTIVIVDDDSQFCKTLAGVLRLQGFTVAEITDPREAMRRLEVAGQVVLLDMNLGDLSGLDVLRAIRERNPHMPVVLVTGFRQEMTPAIETALSLHAHTCLYKPFEMAELERVLADIRRQELRRVLGRGVAR